MNAELGPYIILGVIVLGVAAWRGWLPIPSSLFGSKPKPFPSEAAPIVKYADPLPGIVEPKPYAPPDVRQECSEALDFLAQHASLLTSNEVGLLLSVVARHEANRKIDAENANRASKAVVDFHSAPFAGAADPSQPASE